MARILVVDDSATVRESVKTILLEKGHEVLEAEDGVTGIAKFNESVDIQMILSDVNMPNMDGITMISRIKELEKGKNVPVLMLTTESSPELKAKGKSVGVMAWMIKPLNAEKILMAIDKLVTK